MSVVYLFELPNPPYKKPGWYRARYQASREHIEGLGGRIIGAPEVRTGVGGTAGHVQMAPPSSPGGILPSDFCDGIEPSDPVSGSPATERDSQASRDNPTWGTRRTM